MPDNRDELPLELVKHVSSLDCIHSHWPQSSELPTLIQSLDWMSLHFVLGGPWREAKAGRSEPGPASADNPPFSFGSRSWILSPGLVFSKPSPPSNFPDVLQHGNNALSLDALGDRLPNPEMKTLQRDTARWSVHGQFLQLPCS